MNFVQEVLALSRLSRVITGFAAILCLSGVIGIGLAWQSAMAAEVARVEAIDQAEERLKEFYYPTRYFDEARRHEPTLVELMLVQERLSTQNDSAVPVDNSAWLQHSGGFAAIAFLASVLGLAIAGLVWVWRATRNLARAGIDLRCSPGRAVAGFVAPLLNLVLPLESMRELHNRSRGRTPEHAQSSNEEVSTWFVSYIIGIVILYLILAKHVLSAITPFVLTTPWWMELLMISFAASLLLLASCLFAGMTARITAAQGRLLADWDAESDAEPVMTPQVTLMQVAD